MSLGLFVLPEEIQAETELSVTRNDVAQSYAYVWLYDALLPYPGTFLTLKRLSEKRVDRKYLWKQGTI